MNQTNLSVKVLKRFINKEEFKRLNELYDENKKKKKVGRSFIFTEEDLQLFKTNKLSWKEWRKHWGLKTQNGVLLRLGRMSLLKEGKEIEEPETKKSKSSRFVYKREDFCRICRKPIRIGSKRYYCSVDCAEEAKRIYQRNWVREKKAKKSNISLEKSEKKAPTFFGIRL